MVVTYHQRQLHIKIQVGILTAEPYQPATHGEVKRQQQLEFLRLNPAESRENAPLNHRPVSVMRSYLYFHKGYT
jgi:hypothetical protein